MHSARILKGRRLLLSVVLSALAAPLPAAERSDAAPPVEAQPLLAQVRRLREALDTLGQPLPAPVRTQLDAAERAGSDAAVTRAVESALDALCLGTVRIDVGGKLTFTPAASVPRLQEQGWRAALVKVVNLAGVTRALWADSPGARALPESPREKLAERWIDLETIDRRPLQGALSGLSLEFRVLNLWARAAGRHESTLAFRLGPAGSPHARLDEVQRRRWDFDHDAEGWEAQNHVRFEPRDGALVLHSTGGDPFLTVNVRMAAGRKLVRFRARSFAEATWQLFWWTEKRPTPHGGAVTSLLVGARDGAWAEYSALLQPADRMLGFRLDPGNQVGESALDWIEISSLDEPGAEWAQAGLTFEVEPTRRVTFRVRDEQGAPAFASFVIRDAQGRIYPMQSKRLGGDFFFQRQIYRGDGETITLPDGNYTVECARGPESVPETRHLLVGPRSAEIAYRVTRWTDPAARGWFSGDHHIHAAGCLHYAQPEAGVHPADMQRHIMGEDLKVGCSLTWGPGFDFQKQFFCGAVDPVSTYPYLLRYDIEVSGFGSHQSGHLNLLRLRDQMYPGGRSKDHWPTLGLNTLRWAKAQGAVCGPAHSGLGLQGSVGRVGEGPDGPGGLPGYDVPLYDGIGANEFVMNLAHEVPGPDGRPVPAVDFISTMNTSRRAEWNMWYHSLNAGFRVRASGETDFPCMSGARVGAGRVYVKQAGKLAFDDWAEGIREGRSYVSDGTAHLMEFRAAHGAVSLGLGERGSELRLPQSGKIKFTALAAVRQPPASDALVELIVNGLPVSSRRIAANGREEPVTFELALERSSWVALRVGESAHTNPFFVLVEGQPVRASRRSVEWLLAGVDQCWKQKEPTYAAAEKETARADYEHARQTYRRLLDETPAAP